MAKIICQRRSVKNHICKNRTFVQKWYLCFAFKMIDFFHPHIYDKKNFNRNSITRS
jgi:hypothetical protein